MKPNIVKEKSYAFALAIIKLSQHLRNSKHFEISSQLIRSGTSIGANIEEATASHSRADFAYRMTVASKEARETHYWLRLIRDSKLVRTDDIDSIIEQCHELIKLLASIVKTITSKQDIKI